MSVLVCAEARRGVLRDTAFELLSAAAALGGPIHVLLVGADPAPLNVPGVETILHAEREHFEPQVQAAAVKATVERLRPDWVLAPHSIDAMSYAPAVAAELGFGFASDVHALEPLARGAAGGKLVATLELPQPALLMLRLGAFPAAASGGGSATIETIDLDESVAAVEHVGYREPAGDVDITTADFLLALGGGVTDAEGLAELEQLAQQLSATLAVSRPLVDAKLVSIARQVGQSGKVVKPKVYLALGISGAVQHMAGVRGADTIIAVNTDPYAPIFQFAHYGAVADLFEVARALASEWS